MISIILFAIFAPAYFALAWFFVCNFITYYQRGRVIEWVLDGDGSTWMDRSVHLESVSYEEHMFRLFTLRNPYKLYHPTVREALSK